METVHIQNVDRTILEKTIEVALEIARQGREGKKVGTAFIIAEEDIHQYTRQLIMNPFAKEDKNIIDQELKETIKEFAQLDGVFILNKEGKILSAGTFLDVDSTNLYLPAGYGTRHRCCAAITHRTDALAILVSESGGVVKIFRKGKIIQTL